MPDHLAISVKNLNKNYRLYGSVADQVIDVFGLTKLMFWKRLSFTEHHALSDVNLEVKKGERVGIVGRNGAGKSTLLKLITGNFAASSGEIKVNGNVQALMNVGLGFHPEFSGLENIRSSLTYNGIPHDRLESAIQDVVDFAELEEYLLQPMKTYSLGMQARLMFGAATAITPDILIVDEVLGAGDAYFSVKSAHRMEKLTGSGCSLLLVSHSTQQILQFCERAIWIESGRIVMDDSALSVVKAYEEFTQKLSLEAEEQIGQNSQPTKKSVIHNTELRSRILNDVLGVSHHGSGGFPGLASSEILSDGKVSRWKGAGGLQISSISVRNGEGRESRILKTGEPLSIDLEFEALETGNYPCYFVILLFSEDGRWVSRHCSDRHDLTLGKKERGCVRLNYDELLLGNGIYMFSAAIYSDLDLREIWKAKFYDLLSRSFEFEVVSSIRDDESLIHHPSFWEMLR